MFCQTTPPYFFHTTFNGVAYTFPYYFAQNSPGLSRSLVSTTNKALVTTPTDNGYFWSNAYASLTDEQTFAGWFSPSSYTNCWLMVNMNSFGLYMSSTGALTLYVWTSSSSYQSVTSAAGVVPIGVFSLIVASVGQVPGPSYTYSIYVNGVSVADLKSSTTGPIIVDDSGQNNVVFLGGGSGWIPGLTTNNFLGQWAATYLQQRHFSRYDAELGYSGNNACPAPLTATCWAAAHTYQLTDSGLLDTQNGVAPASMNWGGATYWIGSAPNNPGGWGYTGVISTPVTWYDGRGAWLAGADTYSGTAPYVSLSYTSGNVQVGRKFGGPLTIAFYMNVHKFTKGQTLPNGKGTGTTTAWGWERMFDFASLPSTVSSIKNGGDPSFPLAAALQQGVNGQPLLYWSCGPSTSTNGWLNVPLGKIVQNTWQHWAFTVAANGTGSVYVDGVLAVSGAGSCAVPITTRQYLNLGRSPYENAAINASFANLQIINHDVSASEVASMVAGNGCAAESFVTRAACWHDAYRWQFGNLDYSGISTKVYGASSPLPTSLASGISLGPATDARAFTVVSGAVTGGYGGNTYYAAQTMLAVPNNLGAGLSYWILSYYDGTYFKFVVVAIHVINGNAYLYSAYAGYTGDAGYANPATMSVTDINAAWGRGAGRMAVTSTMSGNGYAASNVVVVASQPVVDSLSGLSLRVYNGYQVNSEFGGSLEFDGGDAYTGLGTYLDGGPYTVASATAMYVSMWIKPYRNVASEKLFDMGSGISNATVCVSSCYGMAWIANGGPASGLQIGVKSYDGSVSAVASTTSLVTWNVGAWNHVVGVWSGSVLKLYLNGALVTNSMTGSPMLVPAGYRSMFRFGAGVWGSGTSLSIYDSFQGRISDVHLGLYELQAHEVVNLYSGSACSSPPPPPSPPPHSDPRQQGAGIHRPAFRSD